jgi:glycosyltransferase involved in cell wall biosynthesis
VTTTPAVRDRRRRPRLAYIVRSYPRLSQTHILNEILGLERLGHDISIFGMTRSGEKLEQDGVARVRARASFLEDSSARGLAAALRNHVRVFSRHPVRYAATAAFLARRRDLTAGYTTTTRAAAFGQAVYLAAEIGQRSSDEGDGIDHVHSHFAHDPTLLALLVGRLTGIPYSFTAHARDMYQIPPSSLAERIARASAVVTICQANVDYLGRVAPHEDAAKLHLVRTGIDVDAWRPADEPATRSAPVIVVVSRLVPKKGLLDLVAALEVVKADGRDFRCVIYGEGPLRPRLEAALTERGLTEEVELAGPATQEELRSVLRSADIFALTPFVTDDGDREGLPSSMLEAMACGLPVVGTAVAGIPEAVTHGETGLLAQPRDHKEIAAHIESLVHDPGLRKRLGANARAAIERGWDARAVAQQLASVFDDAAGAHR